MSAISIMNEEEVQNAEAIAPESGFGCVSTSRGNLPVKAMDVRTQIVGLIGETVVRQTYQNAFNEPLEATYIFPLPDRGAVSDFKMIVGDRVIDGEIKERGQARRDYQAAIDAGHRASIVEEERPDTFTMRVGNVDAGEEITIEFKVTVPLIFADGEATFRFPLVVAPRYIPGTPLAGGNVGDGTAADTDAVPDASRISPPVLLPSFPSPISLSLECEIRGGGMEISNLRSSLHAVTLSQGDGVHKIAIQPGERLNRDFILRFDVASEDVVTSLNIVRDAEGDEGTFMLTLIPPALNASPVPRDVVFVLDRSGSMSGWKMVAARRALGRMLDTLGPKDRFEVIAFDNTIETFGSGLQDATNRNRFRAIEKLGTIDARGGTEMARPLYEGMDLLGSGYRDRRRMLVLVTDGQVGNEDQIVRELQSRDSDATLLTVGIDQAVNAGFLNRLASIGGGRCELVESEDRLDEAMDRIHRVIATPVLTEVGVWLSGADPVGEFVPSRTPDLFEGAPLTVFGRFKGAGVPTLEVAGAQSNGDKWKTSVRGREVGSKGITAVWARQLVRELEDAYAKSSSSELSERITKHSIRFGVLCRFTSWVAVDRASKIESKGDLRQVMQPVEQPEGWGGALGAAMAPPAPSAPMPRMAPKGGAPMRSRAAAPPPPQSFAAPQGASYGSGFADDFSADFDDEVDAMYFEEPAMEAPDLAMSLEEATSSNAYEEMRSEALVSPLKEMKKRESGGERGGGYAAKASVEALEAHESVQRRPGMYVPGTARERLHRLVEMLVQNAVDESKAGFGTRITVTLHQNGAVTVSDDGRGISVDMNDNEGLRFVEIALTRLGNHAGLPVVNFLSEWLEVEIRRDGRTWHQRYEGGLAAGPFRAIGESKTTGTTITFKPDPQYFEGATLSADTLRTMLLNLAGQGAPAPITLVDKRANTTEELPTRREFWK